MSDKPFTHEDVQTPEDLDRLDKEGLIAFMRSGREDKVPLWNQWRTNNNWKDIDLSRANLPDVHLEGARLSDIHFEGANLRWAHLSNANLRGAHLEAADLNGAYLNGVSLRDSYMTEANLFRAHLTGAELGGAQLREADLSRARLEGADLRWAVLAGAQLQEANLEKADLRGAVFDRANLRLAHLRDTALSAVADGGLSNVKLYQTYFWGVLSLRYEQFLEDESDPNSRSTIWEDTECRYSEAKDVYKSLKGYFEDAGDYEGANWAYRLEQEMEKFVYMPAWARRFYRSRKWEPDEKGHTFWKPNTVEWLRLEISDKLAGYGLSLTKPLFWLAFVILSFALIYWAFGMITDIPGCEYPNPRTPDCRPGDFLDALVFSVSAMTTVDSGTVQPYLSNVSLTASVEALLGIALTGLFGFVLGNKLRNS